MKRSIALKRAGVTLTELLVVLVIISILATIAVPVYINKAENARVATAQAECKMIAEAEDTCAMHHGFYVPLQMLDDMPAKTLTSTYADAIDKETNTIYLVDPNLPLQYLDGQPNGQVQLNSATPDLRVTRMINNWQGPFLNPQRVYQGLSTSADPFSVQNYVHQDYPLDPWGNPYRFYAPYPWGVIGSTAFTAGGTTPSDLQNPTFSDGKITTLDNSHQFDRYAIVSYGPNGIPNDNTIQNSQDDVMYFFGRVVATSTSNNTGNTSGTATATPTPVVTP